MDDEANLVNTDSVAGFPVEWRHDDLSASFRLYRQSSHLGDEALVEGMRERYDLSYEAIELLLSYERFGFRAYGGGENIVRRAPSECDRKLLHWGLEARTPEKPFDAFRLAAGVDVKYDEEFEYSTDASVRAGTLRTASSCFRKSGSTGSARTTGSDSGPSRSRPSPRPGGTRPRSTGRLARSSGRGAPAR